MCLVLPPAGEDRTTAVFSGSVSDDLKDFIKAEKMPTTIAFDRVRLGADMLRWRCGVQALCSACCVLGA